MVLIKPRLPVDKRPEVQNLVKDINQVLQRNEETEELTVVSAKWNDEGNCFLFTVQTSEGRTWRKWFSSLNTSSTPTAVSPYRHVLTKSGTTFKSVESAQVLSMDTSWGAEEQCTRGSKCKTSYARTTQALRSWISFKQPNGCAIPAS